MFENTSDHKLKHTQAKPSGSATDNANYLVRLLRAKDGKYYVQNGLGNYMGTIAASTNVPTTAVGTEAVTIAKISNTDGHFYLQGTTNNSILDANDFTAGDPATVVGWGTSAPTTTGGNNDWAFYPVELVTHEDKFYRIRNKMYGYYMKERFSTHQVGCEEVNTTAFNDYTALWKLSIDGNSLKMQNAITGRYIQRQGYQVSVPYTTQTSASSFTLTPVEGEDNTYTITDQINNNASYTSMHCAASQNYYAVGWYANGAGDASVWIFEEVTPDNFILQVSRDTYQDMMSQIENASVYTEKLAKYFTDGTCTTLKDAYKSVTDETLTSDMTSDGLPAQVRNMALKVKNNTWTTYSGWDKTEKTFRVADYQAYSDNDKWTQIFKIGYKLSRITSPTGISASANSTIFLFAGPIPANQTVMAELVPSGSATGTTTTLHEGTNVIYAEEDCTIFIRNSVDNTNPMTPIANYSPVTIHIEGGEVNGYFDLTKGDDDGDWAKMMTHMLSGNTTDLKTERLVFHVPTTELKDAVGYDMVGVLTIWDSILKMERDMQGLEEYEGYYNNVLAVISPTSDYMHAANFGTYYADYTISSIMNYDNMSTNGGNIWGPAHEMGHIHQAPINMVGCTEVSNNLFSNVAVYNQGHQTSRAESIQKTFDDFMDGKSWLDRVFNTSNSADLWQCTHLYWQLYQYFHIVGHNTRFYPELYKALRADPMTHSGGIFIPASDDYLKFYKKCCEVSGYDLTEFFQVYGFFTIPTQQSYTLSGTTRDAHLVGDYGNYYVYTTQEMIDAAKAEVAAMNLKPCNIIFIEDRVKAPLATYEGHAEGEYKKIFSTGQVSAFGTVGETGQYTEFNKPCTPYTYNVSGNTVTMDGSGAVGFKVYDNSGNLVGVYNTNTFTLPTGLENFTIQAAAGNGSNVTATYDSNQETFPKASTWYTFCTPLRGTRYMHSSGAGNGVYGETFEGGNQTDDMMWKFVERGDGSYDIINRSDNSYLDPTISYNNQMKTTASRPSSGWTLSPAATEGMWIIYDGTTQLNQGNNLVSGSSTRYIVYNWGNGSNTSDTGCQFTIMEAQIEDLNVYKNVLIKYVNGGYYTTIYSPFALELPTDGEDNPIAKAYAGFVDKTNGVIKLEAFTDNIIPAYQGALVEFLYDPNNIGAEPGDFYYTFTPTTAPGTLIEGNRLTGTLVDTNPSTYSPDIVLTFGRSSGNLGFYKYSGSSPLKAGKAFLVLTDDEYSSIRSFTIGIPTGINDINLRGTSEIYDIQGRRVNKAVKGIYIINGKKVIK